MNQADWLRLELFRHESRLFPVGFQGLLCRQPRCFQCWFHSRDLCIPFYSPLHVFDACGFALPHPTGAILFSTSQLLSNHYEQCWKYYCLPSGWGSYGLAVEEELHLTEKLFWGIFDSLSHKVMAVLPEQKRRPH